LVGNFIAWDESKKPRGRIDINYKTIKQLLDSQGFESYQFSEFPIIHESLKPYDILVFACPDFAKITPQEINEIENWVREDGGGLLLLSHAGGDKGRQTNLSALAERFGITFENDQVLSPNNYGMENLPKVSTFTPPHQINEGISEICYRAGCSLTTIGGSIPIAMSDPDADPFSVPLIVVSEADNGLVCVIGSYEIFRDEIGCGIENEQHKKLALNLFNWLISEHRLKLKEKGISTIPSKKPGLAYGSSLHPAFSDAEEKVGSQPYSPITVKSEIKISSKSDLIQTLYSVLDELNALSDVVNKLIDSVIGSEDEIIELQAIKEMQEKIQQPPQLEEPPDLGIDFEKLKKEVEAETAEEDNELTDLTELPKKPSTKKPLPPRPKGMPPQNNKQSKEELAAELEGLEGKVKTVNNLITFLKKKKRDGKIKQNDYDKQMKKLKYDLENATNKIDELKKLLKKK